MSSLGNNTTNAYFLPSFVICGKTLSGLAGDGGKYGFAQQQNEQHQNKRYEYYDGGDSAQERAQQLAQRASEEAAEGLVSFRIGKERFGKIVGEFELTVEISCNKLYKCRDVDHHQDAVNDLGNDRSVLFIGNSKEHHKKSNKRKYVSEPSEQSEDDSVDDIAEAAAHSYAA